MDPQEAGPKLRGDWSASSHLTPYLFEVDFRTIIGKADSPIGCCSGLLIQIGKEGIFWVRELLVGARLRVGRRILKAIGGDSQTLVN